MSQSNEPVVQVQLEAVNPELAELLTTASPLPEFLVVCVNAATEIAHVPENVKLVITGDFVQSVKARLSDTEAAGSFNLSRGEGVVAGKTMRDGDYMAVILHAAVFQQALDYRANPDAAELFLRTLVHEMNHVSMWQRGESAAPTEITDWKLLNLMGSASAIIDEYRAEVGAQGRMRRDECDWNPNEIILWLERTLIDVVTEYQDHQDVRRLVFEVGSKALIALKQLAFCVAYEYSSGDILSLDLKDLRYAKTRLLLPQWFDSYREFLSHLPPGEAELPRDSELEALLQLSQLLDEHLSIVGFDWYDSWFQIEHGLLELI